LALDEPRIIVINDTPCSPTIGLATHAGSFMGGFAPSASARPGNHSATGAGWSSTMLYKPGSPWSSE